jgi:rSAM/selenodomain-associated transferase 1
MITSGDVLGLFAKWPEPEQVKTRLAAETSPRFAAEVARAFLEDCLERYSRLDVRPVLAFSPEKASKSFDALAPMVWEREHQTEGNLGQRMADFFTRQFSLGAARVVLIGTDSPTAPVDFVKRAFAELEKADLVLGPATDGGYYLVGGTPRMPSIFTDIDWGSSNVLAHTIAQLPPSTKLALLPPWYDVDTLACWQMLQGHLLALRLAGVDPMAPRTECLAGKSWQASERTTGTE